MKNLALFVSFLIASMTATASTTQIAPPVELTVGPMLTNPLGYGERAPQFSWKLPANTSERQSAYQIVCGQDVAGLAAAPDRWDSGWVESAQSTFVDYKGSELASRERVYWQVRYKDAAGAISEWSEPAWFELSLLDISDWQAKWIYLPKENPDATEPTPFLRKEFATGAGTIERARIYASARGIFELELNGKRVGDNYFAPEWTHFSKRSHFITYDVTSLLKAGENTIGGILGEMWYAGKLGYSVQRDKYGKIPELLLQLEITYSDGHRQVIVSDETWKAATGPIRFANIYDGEHYDARMELGKWSCSGYDDSEWSPVETVAIDESVVLMQKPNQPVRATLEKMPIALTQPAEGVFVFDFGQNLVGIPRITVPGMAGNTYVIRVAEMLQDDGTLYTENYRSAESSDIYISKGDPLETWQPRLTFHGYRYLELTGLPEGAVPDLGWVTTLVLHNDMPQTGGFTSSDPTLNRLQANIEWGQRGNFLAVPTDCPQRDERLGWTGDAQVFCATANYNFNTLAFFVKWCADMRDCQKADGSIPFFVPDYRESNNRSSSAWGDAAVIVPWEVYQSFGYERILADNYEMMRAWVRHYEESEDTKDYVHGGFSFGDWLQPYTRAKGNFGETDNALIGTAYFARSADLTARAADILGKHEEAEELRALFNKVATAFQASFFDADGKMTTQYETQTGYLLGIAFGLLDEAMEEKVMGHLVRHIRETADGHLRTGFVGTPIITPVLSANGETDLAYELLFKRSYPGWFYSIEQGATTMWERWNSYSRKDGFGDAGMNSFNHYAYGAIGDWMYETVAGLKAVEPGFKRIRFSPQMGSQLDHASARLETPYGLAESSWERVPGGVRYDLRVPPNTTGEFAVDDGVVKLLEPGSHSFLIKD